MPLAYVHIVHVMIHLLLVLAPIALYPKVGALTVLLIPLLTLFYHGLLELAMSFLVTAHSGSNPTHPTHNRLTPYSPPYSHPESAACRVGASRVRIPYVPMLHAPLHTCTLCSTALTNRMLEPSCA